MRALQRPMNRLRAWLVIAAVAFGGAPVLAADLPAGHAHNDYRHARPLLDALDHGFRSVEADVFLRDGRLLVAHDANEIAPDRTLQSLYLEPLKARIGENGGSVHGDGRPLVLLIDVKTDAEDTYAALHSVLGSFESILTAYSREGIVREGPVVAIVSGNRTLETMAAQDVRYAAYDGRLEDLGADAPASLIPLISDRWTRTFSWQGDGAMSPRQRARLEGIVAEAHAAGRQVRFWATPEQPRPDREAVWRVLRDVGVDFINTDSLVELEEFLAKSD